MTLVKSKVKAKSATQRRRSAEHHRKSQHYVKAYWPYLPIVLIFVLGFFVNNSLENHPKVLGADSDFSNQSFLLVTNQQRAGDNESALTLNSQLDSAAQAKANAMVAQNFWSHDTPSGQTPWTFITAAGYEYQSAGENLAYGFDNADDTVTAWMNSPEHRANILNPNFDNVGFGVASSPDFIGKGPEIIVVAEYAQPISGTVASISFNVPPPSSVLGTKTSKKVNGTTAPASLVSRIQLITGGKAAWSLAAASFITGILLCLFVIRHARRFKRLVVDGEHIITRHYYLDILLALIITIGFILTRTSGVIR